MNNKVFFKSPVDGRVFTQEEWFKFDNRSGIYAVSDLGFKFNVLGSCLNRNKNINIEYGRCKAEIESFEYKEKWGNSICLSTNEAGCAVGTYFVKYDTEKEAIFNGLEYARKWFSELADKNASKIIKEISSLIERYNPKQLELF